MLASVTGYLLVFLVWPLAPTWPVVASDLQSRVGSPAASAGVLQGTVVLKTETAPEPTLVRNTTDPVVCGRTHTLDDLLVSARNRGIGNVIVALDEVPAEKVPSRAPVRLVIDNRQCRFVPRVSVLTVGSTVEAQNSDPVLHTVHFYGAVETNLAVPLKGMKVAHRIDRTGMIMVKCDVHGWMQAFIRVDPHPFHAVSDAAGSFRIPDIPAGRYRLHIWHEKLGEQRRQVDIHAGKVTTLAVEY